MKKFISLFMMIILLLCFTGCNANVYNRYSKEITNNDVIVEMQSDSLFFKFKVRPQKDVSDLMITIGFYDKNSFPVGARNKRLGKVISGHEYSIEFGSDDFSAKEFFAISKWKFLKADGTIWIEQEIKSFCIKHNYDNGYISKSPTCGYLGEKIYTCTTCNYKKSEYVASTEHNWLDNKYSDTKYICDQCCIRCDWKD